MCIAHYLQERKGGRKEETEKEKVKGKKGHREGEEGWKKKGNYYWLFQRMVQNRTYFHWATQSQLRWMPRSFVFPWPYFYSLYFSFSLSHLCFPLLVLPVVKPWTPNLVLSPALFIPCSVSQEQTYNKIVFHLRGTGHCVLQLPWQCSPSRGDTATDQDNKRKTI